MQVPNPHSQGPAVDDPHTHEEYGHPEHEDILPKKEKPTPSPEVSEDMFDDIMMKLKSGPDPLDSVIIGRRLLR